MGFVAGKLYSLDLAVRCPMGMILGADFLSTFLVVIF
jgi:hypothetical protein